MITKKLAFYGGVWMLWTKYLNYCYENCQTCNGYYEGQCLTCKVGY